MKLLIATGHRPPNAEKLRRELDDADLLLVDDSLLGRTLYGQNLASRRIPCTVFDSDGARLEWAPGVAGPEGARRWTGDTMLDALLGAATTASAKGHAVTLAHTGEVELELEGVRLASVA